MVDSSTSIVAEEDGKSLLELIGIYGGSIIGSFLFLVGVAWGIYVKKRNNKIEAILRLNKQAMNPIEDMNATNLVDALSRQLEPADLDEFNTWYKGLRCQHCCCGCFACLSRILSMSEDKLINLADGIKTETGNALRRPSGHTPNKDTKNQVYRI